MVCTLPGFWNKVQALVNGIVITRRIITRPELIPFLGPGWAPGKPRLGDIKDIPEIDPSETKRKVGNA